MTTTLPWGLLEAVVAPFTDPASRTFWPGLLVAAGLALVVDTVRRRTWPGSWRDVGEAVAPSATWRHRSTRLDVQLLLVRQLLRVAGWLPAVGTGWWLATGMVRRLDGWLGVPGDPGLPAWAVTAVYSAVLFVAWDASRYVLHRVMHEVPALWRIHQVHHSAEVLTPLTFFRLHPLESMLYGLRGALVTGVVAGAVFWWARDQATLATVFGVHAVGWGLNMVFGNLRHSHVWLPFGRWERWFVSPAQHQLHHAVDPAVHGRNYGTWLAVWDWWGGTWCRAEAPPTGFGVTGAHHDSGDLVGALWCPIRPWAPAAAGAAALLTAWSAWAQEPDDEEEFDEEELDEGAVVVVESDARRPRVAGSAHVIDAERLEQQEYDDIHRVLAEVPGVYTRDEEGFGLRPNIGIRGANSDRSARVTLMEDGVLFGPAPYAAPAAYYFPMATRLVGVEVFKGPASIRSGPSTVGGAINLRTRAVPDEVGLHGGADVAAGMRSTVKAHAWGAVTTPNGGALLEAVHLSSGGFKVLDDGGPTGFDRQDVMFKGVSRPNGVDEIEVKLGYGHERSFETYVGLTQDDLRERPYLRYPSSALARMRWHRSQAELAWTHDAGPVQARTVAYHHFLTRQWRKLNRFAGGPPLHDILSSPDEGANSVYAAILRGDVDSAGPDERLYIGPNDCRFHSFGVQSSVRWTAGAGIVRSRLEVGLRLHGDVVRRIHTEDAYDMVAGELVPTGDDTLTTRDSVSEASALALHVHDDLLVGPIRLTPGVRMEVIRTREDRVADADDGEASWRVMPLPGVGILGSPAPWVDLFAGVHRGFSPVAPGQPDEVRPETSWSYEGGARFAHQELNAEVVGFFNDYANLVGACTFSGGCTDDQVGAQFNGGQVHVWGVEALVNHRAPLRGRMAFTTQATYTYTGSSFRSAFVSGFPQFGAVEVGDQLPYVPEHQAALRLGLEHPRFRILVAGNARSALRDEASQGAPDPGRAVPPLVTLDLSFDVAVVDRVRLYATGHNLSNVAAASSWRPYGARPVHPLQVMVGLKVDTP